MTQISTLLYHDCYTFIRINFVS